MYTDAKLVLSQQMTAASLLTPVLRDMEISTFSLSPPLLQQMGIPADICQIC